MQRIILDAIADNIRQMLPEVSFEAGEGLRWSPKTKTITYRRDDASDENIWGLLHEAGHASLNHLAYSSDIELLQLEAAAWEAARGLGKQIGHAIDPEHVQDCLDTYRDWLHQRSTCPRCGIVSFQETISRYKCHNCHKTWTVSASRLCRPYRLSAGQKKNRPETLPQAVFQARSSS